MQILTTIWNALQVLIGYNLVLPIVLFLAWIVLRSKKKFTTTISYEADYAFIVTAYQFTDNLETVVNSIKKVKYSNYMIYIVADNCDISKLRFDDPRVVLLRPEHVIASNTGSHQFAIDNFVREHERLTIIDSDNLVHPDYLLELNAFFNKGYQAVQGLRSAKNLDSVYACLDAARDIYYHFYDGQILHQLGSSATLSGSGMAFETKLYKEFLSENNIKGAGFDKILQYFIVNKNLQIAFAKQAIVYDEKTSQSEQLVKQRARWINTWFKYFSLGFFLIKKGLVNLQINQLLFGIILLRPPLFIFLIASLVCTFINIILNNYLALSLWGLSFILFILSFVLSLLFSRTDKRIYKSLTGIPKFIFFQVISLFKSKNAHRHSVATQHYHNKNLDEINQYEDKTR